MKKENNTIKSITIPTQQSNGTKHTNSKTQNSNINSKSKHQVFTTNNLKLKTNQAMYPTPNK